MPSQMKNNLDSASEDVRPSLALIYATRLIDRTNDRLPAEIKADIISRYARVTRLEHHLQLIVHISQLIEELDAADLSYQDRFKGVCRAIAEIGRNFEGELNTTHKHLHTLLHVYKAELINEDTTS